MVGDLEDRIIILNHAEARTFVPRRETIIVRVFDTNPPYSKKNKNEYPLCCAESPLILKPILEYDFDDLDYKDLGNPNGEQDEEDKQNYFAFNERVAEIILASVESMVHRNPDADLVCTCFRGESRSPALAMVLNQAFNLGAKNLGFRYPKYNSLVYTEMSKVARRLRLI